MVEITGDQVNYSTELNHTTEKNPNDEMGNTMRWESILKALLCTWLRKSPNHRLRLFS